MANPITDPNTAIGALVNAYIKKVSDVEASGDRYLSEDKKLIRFSAFTSATSVYSEKISQSGNELAYEFTVEDDGPTEISDECWEEIKRCFRYWGHLLNLKCSFVVSVALFNDSNGTEEPVDEATILIDMT